MSPLSSQALDLQQPQSAWDWALEVMLVGLLAFAPFDFGARDARGEEVVLGLCAAMAVTLALRGLFSRHGRHFTWTWAYLPIVLFLCFAALQLLPLPARIMSAISPHTLQIRTDLLGDLPDSPSLLQKIPLTFYPFATSHDLRLVLAIATVFVVVVNVYRRSAQIKRLLWAVTIIGVGVALVAAMQNLTGSRTIYGFVPLGQFDHANSGPFVNHSHFSQFMNLSIGAMLALILVRLGEVTQGSASGEESLERLRIANTASIWVLGMAILLSVVVIVLSLSRGGDISMLVAGAITGMLIAWRRGRSGGATWAVLIVIALLLCLLFVGLGGVYTRLATLRNVAESNGGRMDLLKSMSAAFAAFPFFGTGLGTHRVVFPMFDQATRFTVAVYAENEYAQLLEECGAVGVALAAVFVLIIAAKYFKSVWNTKRPIQLAAFGLGYGLIAILVHSLSDYGQHIPSDALLTAVFCGLLVRLSRFGHPRSAAPAKTSLRARTPLWIGLPLRAGAVVASAALFVLPLRAADTARNEETALRQANAALETINVRGWNKAHNSEILALLRPAIAACAIEPDDAIARYWCEDYRWLTLKRSRQLSPRQIADVRLIVKELNEARPSCPTFGPIDCLAGQLEYQELREPQGEKLVRMGYRLDHNEPISCLAVAAVDAERQKWPDSIAEANRAMELDRSELPDCIHLFLRLNRPDLAFDLVQENGTGLMLLADSLKADPNNQKLVQRCRDKAVSLLLARTAGEGASADDFADAAELYAGQGKDQLAIECYEKALARDYGQVDWRMKLAVLLSKSGQPDQAIREARACLRLRPNMREAADLVETLSAPDTGSP